MVRQVCKTATLKQPLTGVIVVTARVPSERPLKMRLLDPDHVRECIPAEQSTVIEAAALDARSSSPKTISFLSESATAMRDPSQLISMALISIGKKDAGPTHR